MELIEYIRDTSYREIVEEKTEIIFKKNANGEARPSIFVGKGQVHPANALIDRKRPWVRLGRGKRIGVVVSNGYDSVGWSLVRYPDQFDRDTALQIARDREKYNEKTAVVPYSIRDTVAKIKEKSRKVFSNDV